MKFASARAQQQQQQTRPVEKSAAPPIEVRSYTLVYETKGLLSRGRLTLPDGTEETTEWRAYDHGMVAEVLQLLQKWRRAGILGGHARVPRGAQRSGQ